MSFHGSWLVLFVCKSLGIRKAGLMHDEKPQGIRTCVMLVDDESQGIRKAMLRVCEKPQGIRTLAAALQMAGRSIRHTPLQGGVVDVANNSGTLSHAGLRPSVETVKNKRNGLTVFQGSLQHSSRLRTAFSDLLKQLEIACQELPGHARSCQELRRSCAGRARSCQELRAVAR